MGRESGLLSQRVGQTQINVYPVGGLRRLDGRYDSTCKNKNPKECKYISSPEEL